MNETSPTTLDVNVGVCTNGLCGRYDSRSFTSISDVEYVSSTELLIASESPASPAVAAKSGRNILPFESSSPPSVLMFQPHQLWTSTAGSSRHTMRLIVTSPNIDVSFTFCTAITAFVLTTILIAASTSCRPM